MNKRDELDSLLDSALATYVDAEAKPGLAHRVIAVTSRAETSRREPRRSVVRWLAVAVPALAAVLLVAMLLRRHADSPSETVHVVARVPSGASGFAVPDKPARSAEPVARRVVRIAIAHPVPSALPRREVFPTPVPLSAEEQAMLGVADRRSEEVPAQVAQSATRSEQPVEPIHIAAIDIPPLSPPDKGGN